MAYACPITITKHPVIAKSMILITFCIPRTWSTKLDIRMLEQKGGNRWVATRIEDIAHCRFISDKLNSIIQQEVSKECLKSAKKKAEEKGFEYFGIQYKTECWGSPNGKEITYNLHGCKNNCLRHDDGFGVGSDWSNFVYRLKKDWSDCKDGFKYKLVSKQGKTFQS
ncbi:uncharacterized protein LOC116305506 isoform X2 [Actinia tenebrosa]|uniref:Uncharacterized protein LOC116305506 isoform X2 n=1 Tax=Actinia tenebrosa TaxID=6105 RepID=A0A6P8IVI7_ACTTE|nr:uncharacterized protein LOC116305506 isoform X2 [Actinia tenebrosa]